MSVFSDLAAQASPEIVVAIDLESADPVTQALTFYRLTDASKLLTLPGDSPPNAAYRSMLTTGVQTELALTEGPTFTGPAPFNRCAFSVSNAAGVLGNWKGQTWRGHVVTIRIGGVRQANGEPYAFADFEHYLTAQVSSVTASGDSTVDFKLEGLTVDCRRQAVEDVYLGFGGSIIVEQERVRTDLPVLAEITVEFLGRVEALPVGQNWSVIRLSAVAPVSLFILYITAAGELRLLTPSTTVITGFFLTAGQRFHCSLTFGQGFVRAYLVNERDESVEILSEVQAFIVPTGFLFGLVGTVIPGNPASFACEECRIWSTVRSAAELDEHAGVPLLIPSDEPDLLELFRFDEEDGLTAFGEKGALDLTLDVGVSFDPSPSLEGDHNSAIVGLTQPRGWGPQFNVPLTVVSTKANAARWSSGRPSVDLTRVRAGGGEMLPEESYVTANDGDIFFTQDATGDYVHVDPGAGFNLRRFVPGQVDPPQLGQMVDIRIVKINTTEFFRFRVEDIAADFLSMTIVEPLLGGPLSPEGFPPLPALLGSTIDAAPDASSFALDLSTSSVQMNLAPGADLTGDVVDPPGVAATVSAVYGDLIAPAVVVNDLEFDPVVGMRVETGSSVEVCLLLDELVKSALGWRAETRAGLHRIGNYSEPTGPAVASLIGSRGFDVPDLVAPIGRIVKGGIEELESITPYRLTRIGYDRNWSPSEGLIGSLRGDERERLRTPFRETKKRYFDNVDQYGTDSVEMQEPLETLIVGRADAETLSARAEPLLAQRRRWYRITVQGLPLLAVDRADVVLLEHPDAEYGLRGGVLACITAIRDDTASDRTLIECYT